jgi:GT2 family glycosyltransferase
MYLQPSGVEESKIDQRSVLSTGEGGNIAIDSQLLALWKFAAGKDLASILAEFNDSDVSHNTVRAGLSCLVEAGLLLREQDRQPDAYELVSGPLVSIIIVTHNSQEWLTECLDSIGQQTYQPIEVILVDNCSEDDTGTWISSTYPQVNYHRLMESVSFSKAINFGVEKSEGEFTLLLNPDTRLDPNVVSEMYRQAMNNSDCSAVAAKLRFLWAPGFLNGLGNRVGAFSWGTDNGLGHLDLGQFDNWTELPSACFAAAMISKEIWERVGPADEKFPMYYEDSEWSYRARGKGYKVIAAPQAIVYHAFSGRIPVGTKHSLNPAKLENVVFGRLRFTVKLLDGFLFRFLLSYLAADLVNMFRYLLAFKLDLIPAILRGWGRFIDDIADLRCERKVIQSEKVLEDSSLFAIQRDMPETLIWRGLPELTWDLIGNYYLPLILEGKTRKMEEFSTIKRRPKLLIISHDVVDEKLAGPGMRYLEIGRALSDSLDVTIAIPGKSALDVPEIDLQEYRDGQPDSLKKIVDDCDIVLVSSYLVERYPFLWRTQVRIVVDFYDPFVLENLHYYLDEPYESQDSLNQQSVVITNQLAKIGDFFICGNERQRDYWLGVLTANGRVNPKNYRNDPELRSLIDVVGIGYPARPPVPARFLRGVHPLVPSDARIVLWGGGIWNWLDPLTLIRAWPAVVDQYPQARLIFLGTRHPNPDIPSHKMAKEAQSLAEEIGEKDKTIIFFEWLSYEQREALLCEADIGVTLHPVHIETRYSIRTRMMDYLWAKLPILVTEGDITSEWVQEFEVGEVVPTFDADAVAQALMSILSESKDAWQPGFKHFDANFNWTQVVIPLKEYCLEGAPAPDRANRDLPIEDGIVSAGSWKTNWARARFIFRSEGWSGLTHRTWRYIQRNIANPS